MTPRSLRWLSALAVCIGCAGYAGAQDPFGPRLTSTRWTMAHGRHDSLRVAGIQTAANPRGNPVAGAPAIVDAIAAQKNPRLITLDLDKNGQRPANIKAPSPIVLAAAPLQSGVSLVVAEVPTGGKFDGWNHVGTRFGDGNLYATVSIPEAKIVAGMELVTFDQLKAYTANSIFFEAPDLGDIVVSHNIEGGRSSVSAKINGKQQSTTFGWANPLELMLEEPKAFYRESRKIARVNVQAKLPTSFEAPCTIRFALESDKQTIIRDVTFPAVTPVNSSRTARFRFEIEASDGSSVKISAVASSAAFMTALPQTSVGLSTFHSRGATLNDTASVQVRKPTAVKEWAGQLTKGDPMDPVRKGSHAKVYTFELKEGQTVLLALDSYQGKYDKNLPDFFDTWLRVEDDQGKQLASDDDGGEGYNAEIEFTAPRTGTYRLIVNSFRSGATGRFALKVMQ